MPFKQEHSGSGDNVEGNKYQENIFYSEKNLGHSINSKINSFKEHENLDFNDNLVLKAFKETISDLIKEEQEKCHNIVPIGHIRNHFGDSIDDDFFSQTMKQLGEEKTVSINKVQICYIPKNLDYSIDI